MVAGNDSNSRFSLNVRLRVFVDGDEGFAFSFFILADPGFLHFEGVV